MCETVANRVTRSIARPVTRRHRWVKAPPRKFFVPPLERCVGDILKVLDIVSKIWVFLRKLFALPSVQSWLRGLSIASSFLRFCLKKVLKIFLENVFG